MGFSDKTSSEAAIAYGHPDKKQTFNENDWSQLEVAGSIDYFRSKTEAELLALSADCLKFVNQHSVTVSDPYYVIDDGYGSIDDNGYGYGGY